MRTNLAQRAFKAFDFGAVLDLNEARNKARVSFALNTDVASRNSIIKSALK
jgi:hypothetical protein